jgi:hypothetical protein
MRIVDSFLIGAVALGVVACASQNRGGAGNAGAQDDDPTLADPGDDAGSTKILTCSETGTTAGIESLDLYRKNLTYWAALTVSGPGDFIETYHYNSLEQLLQSVGPTVGGGGGGHGPAQEVVGESYKGKNFLLTIRNGDASLDAVGPSNAQLYPDEKITAQLSCSAPTE